MNKARVAVVFCSAGSGTRGGEWGQDGALSGWGRNAVGVPPPVSGTCFEKTDSGFL